MKYFDLKMFKYRNFLANKANSLNNIIYKPQPQPNSNRIQLFKITYIKNQPQPLIKGTRTIHLINYLDFFLKNLLKSILIRFIIF